MSEEVGDSDGATFVTDAVRSAGGTLSVWGVLMEDTYEAAFGDGRFLYVRGAALSKAAGEQLATTAAVASSSYRWHVREYTIVIGMSGKAELAHCFEPDDGFDFEELLRALNSIASGSVSSPVYIDWDDKSGRSISLL